MSWFCFSSSVFVSSAVCLRRLSSLVPSRWGHPGLGRVSVLVSFTRSERRLSLLVSFVFLWDGVTLWVKCVLHSPLISIEGLLSLLVSVTSGSGPGSGAFACPLFSLVRLRRLPLCSSSLLWVASFCSMGFLLLASFLASPCWAFRHRFFFGFPLLLSLAASSVPLFLLCSTLLFWVVLRSLGGLLCSFDLASFSFLTRKLLFYCLGFPLLVFRVSRCSSTGFSFVHHCFPFFL